MDEVKIVEAAGEIEDGPTTRGESAQLDASMYLFDTLEWFCETNTLEIYHLLAYNVTVDLNDIM